MTTLFDGWNKRVMLPMQETTNLLDQSNILVLSHRVNHRTSDRWSDLYYLLDGMERQRADAFMFEQDRDAYIAAHALLRLTLSALVDRPPEKLQFNLGAYGKPYLPASENDCNLRFNLTHTRGMVAVALAFGAEVGVDVESREREHKFDLKIANSHFAAEESKLLHALPNDADRGQLFLRLWTLKEAFVKATGRGLSQPLDEFVIRVDPVLITAPVTSDPSLWYGAEWCLEGHRLAAVCAWPHAGEPNFVHLDILRLGG